MYKQDIMTQIDITDSINIASAHNGSTTVIPFVLPGSDLAISEIEQQKEVQTLKSRKRHEMYEGILNNIEFDLNWFKPIAHTFGGIGGCLISNCVLTLFPAHNVFDYPEYWYEFPLQLVFAFLPYWAAMVILRCSNYMNIDSIKNIRNFVTMFIAAAVIIPLLYAAEYTVWTIFLDYPYPMPLNGYVVAITGMLVFFTTLWFRFPLHWRRNKFLRKRLTSFIIAIMLNQCCLFQYVLITKILLTVPANLQWIVALFIPLVREFNIWVGIKWASKASNGDITGAVMACNHAVSTTHALFLTYTVGSNATNVTSLLLLTTDFAINAFTCIRIIYIRYTVGKSIIIFGESINPPSLTRKYIL
jgi:hypothetical protein